MISSILSDIYKSSENIHGLNLITSCFLLWSWTSTSILKHILNNFISVLLKLEHYIDFFKLWAQVGYISYYYHAKIVKGGFQNICYIKGILGLTKLISTRFSSEHYTHKYKFHLDNSNWRNKDISSLNAQMESDSPPTQSIFINPMECQKITPGLQKARCHLLVSLSLIPYSNLPTDPLESTSKHNWNPTTSLYYHFFFVIESPN